MVVIVLDSLFERKIAKINDSLFKIRVEKQMDKIIENPEIGKPMRYARKGTREVYLGSFRLSYAYRKLCSAKSPYFNKQFSIPKTRFNSQIARAASFRYLKEENKLVFLDIYHKDEQ